MNYLYKKYTIVCTFKRYFQSYNFFDMLYNLYFAHQIYDQIFFNCVFAH
jgi:hypothetical protein